MGDPISPGWQAIDEACRRVYGGQEPRHWGALIGWRMGGPDPLDGVSCFEAGDHWHWVGYGLSELYEPGEESRPSRVPPQAGAAAGDSGWGLELTFRLARTPGTPQPPIWPVSLLQNLARQVYRRGRGLRAGDQLDLRGPLAPPGESAADDMDLCAVLFVEDPELGTIETENGSLSFVQAVGITGDELDGVRDWQCEPFVNLMRERNPRLVTDPARRSLRTDDAFERAVQTGIDRDGSSRAAATLDLLRWETLGAGGARVVVDEHAVPELVRMARGRIPFGRAFRLRGPDASVVFWPEGTDRREDGSGDHALHVDLTPDLATVMRASLVAEKRGRLPRRHTWPDLPGLELVVEPAAPAERSGSAAEAFAQVP